MHEALHTCSEQAKALSRLARWQNVNSQANAQSLAKEAIGGFGRGYKFGLKLRGGSSDSPRVIFPVDFGSESDELAAETDELAAETDELASELYELASASNSQPESSSQSESESEGLVGDDGTVYHGGRYGVLTAHCSLLTAQSGSFPTANCSMQVASLCSLLD